MCLNFKVASRSRVQSWAFGHQRFHIPAKESRSTCGFSVSGFYVLEVLWIRINLQLRRLEMGLDSLMAPPSQKNQVFTECVTQTKHNKVRCLECSPHTKVDFAVSYHAVSKMPYTCRDNSGTSLAAALGWAVFAICVMGFRWLQIVKNSDLRLRETLTLKREIYSLLLIFNLRLPSQPSVDYLIATLC